MPTEQNPRPSLESILLSAWKQAVDPVLTWLEEAGTDHTGLGFTPRDRVQLNQTWRGQQRPGGRLSGLVALASQAVQAARDAGRDDRPAKEFVALLQSREMPTVADLTTAADLVKRELEAAAEAAVIWKDLRAITDPAVNTELETITQWRQLVSFGTQCLARLAHDGRRYISFSDRSPQSPRMAWANTTRVATDSVVMIVRRAGRDLDLTALRQLVHRLQAGWNGNEIEIERLLPAIHRVVDESEKRFRRSPPPAVVGDPWAEQVRELLERGSVAEALQLADNLWSGDERLIKWQLLMDEVTSRIRASQHLPESPGNGGPARTAESMAESRLDPDVEWVSASSLIGDDARDATAVRRFCEQHQVRMHCPRRGRRLVDKAAYRAARKAIAKKAEREIEGIAARHATERGKKEQGAPE